MLYTSVAYPSLPDLLVLGRLVTFDRSLTVRGSSRQVWGITRLQRKTTPSAKEVSRSSATAGRDSFRCRLPRTRPARQLARPALAALAGRLPHLSRSKDTPLGAALLGGVGAGRIAGSLALASSCRSEGNTHAAVTR